MQILGTDDYRITLESYLSNSNESVFIVSAYITKEGIDWILSRLPPLIGCNVLTRWDCSDLVSGASDIEVYNRLKSYGHSLYILPDLHAKAVLIDKSKLFIGSANITNSGLSLITQGNREIGTILDPSIQDIACIESLFLESILIDDILFQDILEELNRFAIDKNRSYPKWSESLLKKFQKPPEKLWVVEMLWCSTPKDLNFGDLTPNIKHDIRLLGLKKTDTLSNELLKEKLIASKCWLWLENRIRNTPKKEFYFGELSAELHNSFLDDPNPYRKDVKGLLSNLLNWVGILLSDIVVVDRPQHSQRIKLIS
ncbi:MAG: phospholipase D-like domain-containing protein [Pyrinomonadaceae bacterium]|nr:phospholipase D-like domain-containing protein [Pyrinomonadaceae bacterium]